MEASTSSDTPNLTQEILNAIYNDDYQKFTSTFDTKYLDVKLPSTGENWLQFAIKCFRGDTRIFDHLVKYEQLLNEKDSMGNTTLIVCMRNTNSYGLLESLIKNPKVDVNADHNDKGPSPIFYAVVFGELDWVKMLLDRPDIDANKVFLEENVTPIEKAENTKNFKIVDLFLENPKVDQKTKDKILFNRERRKNNMEGLGGRIKEAQLKNASEPVSLSEGDSFVVSSGIIVWGQFKTCYFGHVDDTLSKLSPPNLQNAGTILMNPSMRFRSAAKKGVWKVHKLNNSFVIHHESKDPIEIASRCFGVGLGQDGSTWGTVHLNRYDWSWRWDLPTNELQGSMETFLKENSISIEEIEDRRGMYIMVMDLEGFTPNLCKSFVQSCKPTQDKDVRLFTRGDQTFGAYVPGDPLNDPQNDYGWLSYSMKMHEDYDADELVGIAYAYS